MPIYRLTPIDPTDPSWKGSVHKEACAFSVSQNLHRRHLTEAQRAWVGAKIATLDHGGDRKSEEIKGPIGPLIVTNAAAAEMMNVSTRSVKRARAVRRRAVHHRSAGQPAAACPCRPQESCNLLGRQERLAALTDPRL